MVKACDRFSKNRYIIADDDRTAAGARRLCHKVARGHANLGWASKKRLIAGLRMAHHCLGMSRKRLGLGFEVSGGRTTSTIVLATTLLASQGAYAQFVSNNTANAPAPSATGANASTGSPGSSATGAYAIAIGSGATAASSTTDQGVVDFRTVGNPNSQIVNAAVPTLTARQDGIAIGQNSVVNNGGGVALGYSNVAGSTNGFFSTAVGSTNLASGGYATALGVNNTASGGSAVALGVNNTASGVRSVAIGRQAISSGDYSIAQGFVASGYGLNSVAIGQNSTAGIVGGVVAGDVALGSTATATAGNSVALGSGSIATRAGLTGAVEAFSGTVVASTQGAVSVGAAGAERQITNVAGGTLATDAVNIRQLRAVGTSLATSLGAGAAFDPTTGVYVAPTYTIGATNYTNVGAAINALGAAGGGGGGVFALDNTAAAAAPIATGANASAGGYGAIALGAGSTVVGNGAKDNGNANAVAVGSNANVLAANSIAIGAGTSAAGATNGQSVIDFRAGGATNSQIVNLPVGTTAMTPSGVVIGQASIVNAGGGVALGYNNNAGGTNAGSTNSFFSTAIGSSNLASGGYSTAIGVNNQATNTGAVAIGVDNQASGLRSIAIGRQAFSTGALSIAQGFAASGYGPNSVAIGQSSVAGVAGGAATNDVALGSGATSTLGNSVALGAGSVAGRGAETGYTGYGVGTQTSAGELAVGTPAAARTITGVAAGRVPTDAVNVSQLASVSGSLAGSLGGGAGFNATTGVYTPPTFTTAAGTTATTVQGALANETAAIGLLGTSTATKLGGGSAYNPATGQLNAGFTVNGTTYADVATAISGTAGTAGGALASNNAAGAANAVATGPNSTAVGFGASATGGASLALGNGARDNGNANATLVGNGATIAAGLGGSNVALGQGSTVAATAVPTAGATIGGTAYTFAGGTPAGAVSVGAVGAERQIQNVAAGQLTTGSTDAVNGSQLFATNNQVTTNASAIANINNGGGIKYFHSNSTLGDSAASGTNSVAVGPLAVATGASSLALGQGATTSYAGSVAIGSGSTTGAAAPTGAGYATGAAAPASEVSVGTPAAQRRITNLAAGAASTDAVNVGQLNSVGGSLAGSLGGGAGFNATTGVYTPPAFTTAAGTTATTVQGALANETAAIGLLGTSTATKLGGGSAYNPTTGQLNAGFTVNGTTYADVATAISGTAGTAGGALASNNAAGSPAAVATGANSTAAGFGASATGGASLALGNGARDNGNANATLVGNGATIAAGLGGSNVALGQGSTVAAAAVPTAGATIGGTAYTFAGGTPAGAVSVGAVGAERQIQNVAAGQLTAGSTDAVNGSQLFATNNQVTNNANAITALGNGTVGPIQRSATTPNQLVTVAVGGTAATPGAAQTLTNIAPGALTAVSSDAVNGSQLFATNQAVAAAGGQATTLGNSVATNFGGGATFDPATGTVSAPAYTVAGNTYNNVGAAIGAGNRAGVQYGVDAAGNPLPTVDLTKGGTIAPVSVTGLANATAPNGAVALGQMPMQYSTAAAPTTPNPAVPSNDVTLVGANAAAPVALHNLAAGTLSATSTDAVNGSQLYATNQQVAGLTNGTVGLVQQAGPGAPITVGAGTDGTVVDFTNNGGAARTLTGVAAGNVALGSTQAINGGQFFNTTGSLATALGGGAGVNPDGTVSAPTFTVAGATYNNVGGAIGALDTGLASGQIGAFRSDNTAGAAAPAATGANSVAGGFGASATGAGSSVLGNGATDNGSANATVLGNGASVTAGLAGSNIALGQGTVAGRGAETNYAGYGVGTQTSAGELAVGTPTAARTITGVAAGRLSTDAVNVGQLQAVGTNLASSLGGGAGFDPVTGAYTVPTYTVAGATYNNVGGAISAIDSGLNSGQVGAFHSNNAAGAAQPIATGANSSAGGFGSSATGAASTVLGNNATDNGNANAVVLGFGASVAPNLGGTNVALGTLSSASRGAQNAYNAFGLAAPQASVGEVAVGSATNARQITGVAAGSQATDAVNVAQLQGAASNLGNSTAGALGGGSAYDPATGAITAPAYTLNNGTQTYTNVGDALGNLDGRTTSNTNAIAGLQNGTTGLVQQDPVTRAINVGSATDGTTVGFANNAGAARTLTGVAAGQVASNSTQAINGGQLYDTANSVASALGGGSTVTANGTVSAPSYSVGGTAYNNVGGAITALDSTGVKYDTAPGGGRGQSITLAGGDPNQPVVIHNVADGVARTDAANFGQVQDAEKSARQYTNQRVAGLESEMSGMNSRLNGLASDVSQAKKDARTAAAIGLAAASLRYDDRPGRFSVAAGGGYWKGYGAGAFGAGYTLPDGRFRLTATAATDGRDVGAAGGITYTFGEPSGLGLLY